MNHQLPKLWERKTYASALVSALIAAAVAVSVCAAKGETLALGQTASASASQSHTGCTTSLAGGK